MSKRIAFTLTMLVTSVCTESWSGLVGCGTFAAAFCHELLSRMDGNSLRVYVKQEVTFTVSDPTVWDAVSVASGVLRYRWRDFERCYGSSADYIILLAVAWFSTFAEHLQ